jgi:hypothetical protein
MRITIRNASRITVRTVEKTARYRSMYIFRTMYL